MKAKTVTFKIFKSDYTEQMYKVVLNYLCLASKAGHVYEYDGGSRVSDKTCDMFVYDDLQAMVNH